MCIIKQYLSGDKWLFTVSTQRQATIAVIVMHCSHQLTVLCCWM